MPDTAHAVSWQGVAVRYPYRDRDAVGPITLELRAGERLLLLGPSGAGKSTLLHTLTGLIPQTIPGALQGCVKLRGRDVGERSPAAWADSVAQLFQDAQHTLCGMNVADEIAFVLENRALAPERIRTAVVAAMARVGLPDSLLPRRTATLSGGEKQLVAFAATMAQTLDQDAPIFVADEPTAHLTPEAAARLRKLLLDPGAARSVLIVDHRLDGLIDAIDRVAVLGKDGTLVAVAEPRRLFREHGRTLHALGVWQPLASELDFALRRADLASQRAPLTLAEALQDLDALPSNRKMAAVSVVRAFVAARTPTDALDERQADMPQEQPLTMTAIRTPSSTTQQDGEAVARLVHASCAPPFGPTVLRNVTLTLHRGETVAILGRNGAGKSTLGAALAGLLRLKAGRREGPLGGMAFQNPENQFVTASVREELAAACERSQPAAARLRLVDDLIAAWGLAGRERHHPFELSQGEKRRLALATLTADDRWPLLVLDEPTAGLDAAGTATIAQHIEQLARGGRAIAVITHDVDFAHRLCTRAVIVGEGSVLADGSMHTSMRDPILLARAGLEEPAIAPAQRWLERQGRSEPIAAAS